MIFPAVSILDMMIVEIEKETKRAVKRRNEMPKMKVNLPCRIEVNNYHEFDDFQDKLRNVIPGVKVKEVGFNYDEDYVGVVYVGRFRDPTVQKIVKEIKKETEENDNDD